MVAALYNTNHLKSCKHTDADEQRHANTQGKHTAAICTTVVLFMVCFLHKNFECLKCYHAAITIWMVSNK